MDNLSFWKEKGCRPSWTPSQASSEIPVKRLTESAIVPTKAHSTDAGFDLYADEDVLIMPGETKLVKTGIAFATPKGYAGLIWDRSGMGSKGIHRFAGVIDANYRGEVGVVLNNSRPNVVWSQDQIQLEKAFDNTYKVTKGDRIAQIIFQQVPEFTLVEVDNLDDTDRGSKGWGSSGQ